MTYAEVMSGQPLLFNVETLYEMRPQLVEQSVAIIKSAVITWCWRELFIGRDISDALENDRFTPYSVPSAEDYYGSIAKFQLLEETPSVGKTTSFSPEIPLRLFVFLDGSHGSADLVARGDASDAGDTISGRFRELLGAVPAGFRGSGRGEGGVTRPTSRSGRWRRGENRHDFARLGSLREVDGRVAADSAVGVSSEYQIERARAVKAARCLWTGKRANLWRCSRACRTVCSSRWRVAATSCWSRCRKRAR